MIKILIVEDEAIVAVGLQNFLQKEGYEIVDILSDKEKIFQKVIDEKIDLILMDINLKDNSNKSYDTTGITISKHIREYSQVPIIFITSLEKLEIMKKTLDIENSSYLTKPWRDIELLSCINRLTKTTKTIVLDEDFTFKDDELMKNNKVIHLNHQELKLLKLFIENKNKPLSHNYIEYAIWGNTSKQISPTTKTALISKLNSKLEKRFIKTIHKLGYKFVID